MDELAARLGIGKATLYKVFSGKEEVLLAVVRRVASGTVSRIQSSMADPSAGFVDLLRREPWVRDVSIFGVNLHVGVEEEGEGRRRLAARLEQAGIPLRRVDRIVPSLEDVFLRRIEESGREAGR